jgi:FkbM family methyltransferase
VDRDERRALARLLGRRTGGLFLNEHARHRIFQQFTPYDGWAESGYERGYYGVHIRDWVFAGTSKGYTERRLVHVDHPPLDEEYFEWVTLLTTIAQARGRVCIAELGAGWGRWITSAAVLCRRSGIDCSLIGVEAEASRFDMMKTVLLDNYVDPDDHDLLQAAVAARDGEVLLAGNDQRREVYSHQIIRSDEVFEWQNIPGNVIRSVPAYSFKTVCATHQYIDLVDIDVQGAEYDILAGSFEAVSWKIGVVHIGTHSKDVETSLTKLFSAMGWLNAFTYPSHSTVQTPFGAVTFVDGVQTWVNPERPALRAALVGD